MYYKSQWQRNRITDRNRSWRGHGSNREKYSEKCIAEWEWGGLAWHTVSIKNRWNLTNCMEWFEINIIFIFSPKAAFNLYFDFSNWKYGFWFSTGAVMPRYLYQNISFAVALAGCRLNGELLCLPYVHRDVRQEARHLVIVILADTGYLQYQQVCTR